MMQALLTIITVALATVYLIRVFRAQWTRKKNKCGGCAKG
ncbi:MAG: hypothetical protein RL040_1380 [Bacteroidota bacterium]|jgi:hypothetical protein